MFVPIAKATGMALVGLLVIGFCWTLLFGLRNGYATDAELVELLISDLASNEPRLLRINSSAIEQAQADRPALSRVSDLTHNSLEKGETE